LILGIFCLFLKKEKIFDFYRSQKQNFCVNQLNAFLF